MTTPIDGPLLREVLRAAKAAIPTDRARVWAGELLLRDTLAKTPFLTDSQRLECLNILGLSAQQNPR